jgi:hypothetical protein
VPVTMGPPPLHSSFTAIEAHAKDLLVLGATANRTGCYAVWNMFDLAPEGRGDFQPKLDYTSVSGIRSGK